MPLFVNELPEHAQTEFSRDFETLDGQTLCEDRYIPAFRRPTSSTVKEVPRTDSQFFLAVSYIVGDLLPYNREAVSSKKQKYILDRFKRLGVEMRRLHTLGLYSDYLLLLILTVLSPVFCYLDLQELKTKPIDGVIAWNWEAVLLRTEQLTQSHNSKSSTVLLATSLLASIFQFTTRKLNCRSVHLHSTKGIYNLLASSISSPDPLALKQSIIALYNSNLPNTLDRILALALFSSLGRCRLAILQGFAHLFKGSPSAHVVLEALSIDIGDRREFFEILSLLERCIAAQQKDDHSSNLVTILRGGKAVLLHDCLSDPAYSFEDADVSLSLSFLSNSNSKLLLLCEVALSVLDFPRILGYSSVDITSGKIWLPISELIGQSLIGSSEFIPKELGAFFTQQVPESISWKNIHAVPLQAEDRPAFSQGTTDKLTTATPPGQVLTEVKNESNYQILETQSHDISVPTWNEITEQDRGAHTTPLVAQARMLFVSDKKKEQEARRNLRIQQHNERKTARRARALERQQAVMSQFASDEACRRQAIQQRLEVSYRRMKHDIVCSALPEIEDAIVRRTTHLMLREAFTHLTAAVRYALHSGSCYRRYFDSLAPSLSEPINYSQNSSNVVNEERSNQHVSSHDAIVHPSADALDHSALLRSNSNENTRQIFGDDLLRGIMCIGDYTDEDSGTDAYQ